MKVLVAIDSSPSAADVLQAVVTRPWAANSTFCILHVVDIDRFAKLPALIQDATRESEALVKAAAKKICAAGYAALSKTCAGYPRREISVFAKDWAADLILVGSHGHTAIGRFLLGSVAQSVLRSAPCSVEIVRHPTAHIDTGMKVLVAADGSNSSLRAVQQAAAATWPPGTLFRVISAEELMVTANEMQASSLAAIYPATLLEELTTEAHKRAVSAAQTASAVLTDAGKIVVPESSLPIGDPRSCIIDEAKEWNADLILVGSHGRRGLDRFLLGSVSEGVAIHAPCSVRVIRTANAKGDGHET